MTDHNVIRKELQHLSKQVQFILDHHEDEGQHEYVSDLKRNIAFQDGHATVGSTCTLVTEQWKQDLSKHNNNMMLDPNVSLALLGTILLDTVNMSPKAGKGTKRDQDAIQFLMTNTDWSQSALYEKAPHLLESQKDDNPLQPHTTKLFDWLSNAKFDPVFWNEMSTTDCLRIDYKGYFKSSTTTTTDQDNTLSTFGLSSVLLPLSNLISKPNFTSSVKQFMQDKQITLLGILSCTFDSQSNTPQRSMLLIASNKFVMNSVIDYLLRGPEASFLELQ